MDDSAESELEAIQVELEKLNVETDCINKLEIELEEANSTFEILHKEVTRRLEKPKNLIKFIEKARPYYEALEERRKAQIECQKAADKFKRANEIHGAAKETVALAEERFMSNSHEWPFDSAWQEMLNHATQKVMDADTQKSECHAEHLKRAKIFNDTKMKVEELEKNNRRSIAKSKEYFIEYQICEDQLRFQKKRIHELQQELQAAKSNYSIALRNLERISEEIHEKRGELSLAAPSGPREPGVGADAELPDIKLEFQKFESNFSKRALEPCESGTVSSVQSEIGDDSEEHIDENLKILKQKVKTLAVRPVEIGDGRQEDPIVWENELNATVSQLDHLMMIKEWQNSLPLTSKDLKQPPLTSDISLPATPEKFSAIKKLQKNEPLPAGNSSMRELPLLETISKAAEFCGSTSQNLQIPMKPQRRRSLN